MNGNNRDHFPEGLAAELTEAAYAVALRHKTTGSWVDLELALWRALGETVQEWVTRETGEVDRPEGRRDGRRAADGHYVRQAL